MSRSKALDEGTIREKRKENSFEFRGSLDELSPEERFASREEYNAYPKTECFAEDFHEAII